MQLIFDSVDEVVDFVKNHLSTKARKGKAGDDGETTTGTGNAPAPMAPPTGGAPATGFPQGGATGFAAPAGGATQAAGGFPAQGAIGVAPEVQALVQKIVATTNAAISNGQPADKALDWFRGQCTLAGVPTAAQADMNQMFAFVLPALPLPALQNIAKLLNIQ